MTRTARSRKHKGFDLEKRLAAAAVAVEREPAAWRGRWHAWAAPGAPAPVGGWRRVVVDLGCGKGAATVATAAAHPDTLFVGIDAEPVCTLQSAEKAVAAGLPNAVFPLVEDPWLPDLFAPGEIDRLVMNFPTPHPKKKHATLRLTHVDRLIAYRPLLAPGAALLLKTDSDPFLQFSLEELALARYRVVRATHSWRAAHPDAPETEYEAKLVAKGAPVLAVEAAPTAEPAPDPRKIVQTAHASLYDYLPANLDELDYVPHGMEGAVENMRNHARRLAEKQAAGAHGEIAR